MSIKVGPTTDSAGKPCRDAERFFAHSYVDLRFGGRKAIQCLRQELRTALIRYPDAVRSSTRTRDADGRAAVVPTTEPAPFMIE